VPVAICEYVAQGERLKPIVVHVIVSGACPAGSGPRVPICTHAHAHHQKWHNAILTETK